MLFASAISLFIYLVDPTGQQRVLLEFERYDSESECWNVADDHNALLESRSVAERTIPAPDGSPIIIVGAVCGDLDDVQQVADRNGVQVLRAPE